MDDISIEALEDALIDCGLFEGYPQQRRALASLLVSRAVGAQDVLKLDDWSRRAFSPKKRLAGLRGVLEDPKRSSEVLTDIERMAARSRAAAEKTHRIFDDGQPADTEEWTESDRAIAVAIRVDVDLANRGIPEAERIEAVADEFRIDAGLAAHLLAKGRAMRALRLREKVKRKELEDISPAQQLERFRQFLKTGRRHDRTEST